MQKDAGKYAVQAVTTVPGGRAPNCTGFASTVYITLRTELSEPPRLRCGPESLEVSLFAENDLSTEQWAFASTTLVSVAANVLPQAQPDQLGGVAAALGLTYAGLLLPAWRRGVAA